MPNINFPSNPSASQIYTFGSTNWTYNGNAWVASGNIGPQGPGGPDGMTASFTELTVNGPFNIQQVIESVIVNKLEDINQYHKNASQYIVPKMDTYIFK